MKKAKSRIQRIDSFDFAPGRVLARKYEVVRQLGKGWEGEVYLLREMGTNIDRAAKFFYPHRNLHNRTFIRFAKKLHKLRHCPILIQYQTQETITFRRHQIPFLVSEYVDGEMLSHFLKRQPGGRLHSFHAVHLLHALAKGMEDVHRTKEYHGDLHTDNIIIRRYGLGFELKLIDLYHWDDLKSENIRDDVCNLIRVFYESLGGQKHYAKQPQAIKEICCGLKRTLILKKFRTAGHLRQFLENMNWE